MDEAAIDWITERVLQPLARGEQVAPTALAFLLQRYAETGRDDISEALGGALQAALDAASVHGDRRSDRLSLLLDVAAICEDDRVSPVIVGLAASLRGEWPSRGEVSAAMESIDACLNAASRRPDLINRREFVPAAIDELERVVHAAYQPGEGIAHTLSAAEGAAGTLADHVAAASALLTAYAVTGRLPYGMLAEELMQFVRRTESEPVARDLPWFVARSQAVRVLCRLAKLREDEDYREAAVTAGHTDYAGDAKRAVAALAHTYRDYGADAAVYGLAIIALRGSDC